MASSSLISISLGSRNFLDLDVEGGFLAGKVRSAVVRREGHGDGLLVAGLDADELVFEAGNEAAGADDQIGVVVRAAVEGFAVDLADDNPW